MLKIKLAFLVILSFLLPCCESTTNTQDKNSAEAIEEYREVISSELLVLFQSAQFNARRPVPLGGGGNTFNNWVIPDSLRETDYASYQFWLSARDTIVLVGIGKITGEDGVNPVRVELEGSLSDDEIYVIN